MKIALATCTELPDWEHDDEPLHAALAGRGAELAHPSWDDDAVDWTAYDVVLVRTTWNYQEHIGAFERWIERVDAATRLWNPAPVLAWNVRKTYLRELEAAGVPIVPTVWLARGQGAASLDVAAAVAAAGATRGFLKPVVGATARETLRFASDEAGLAAARAHVERLLPHEDLMLQPYLPSVETEGELSAIVLDGQLTHGVRKVPVPGDYRVQDDFGAHDEPFTFDARDLDTVERALDFVRSRFELDAPLLYARADFLRADDGRLALNELELVEPSLFFRHGPRAAERLADALCARASA